MRRSAEKHRSPARAVIDPNHGRNIPRVGRDDAHRIRQNVAQEHRGRLVHRPAARLENRRPFSAANAYKPHRSDSRVAAITCRPMPVSASHPVPERRRPTSKQRNAPTVFAHRDWLVACQSSVTGTRQGRVEFSTRQARYRRLLPPRRQHLSQAAKLLKNTWTTSRRQVAPSRGGNVSCRSRLPRSMTDATVTPDCDSRSRARKTRERGF